MSKQTINIGASPNDGTGTPLRTSFDYTNQNFTEIYTALGGGVALPGATTQVIFNDGGTNLAGDAGLVYNKTTDALTVAGLVTAGSATITGALTVDTSTLVVDATNDRVGIGTITPNQKLEVFTSTADTRVRINSTSVIATEYFRSGTGVWLVGSDSTNAFKIARGSSFGGAADYLSINSATADCTWYDAAAGTRMTLNSTGLGIGAVPSGTNQLTVRSSGAGTEMTASFGRASQEGLIGISSGTNGFVTGSVAGDMVIRSNSKLMLFNNTANSGITIDSSGNVGVGVTPANLAGQTRVEIKGSGSGNLTLRTASSNVAARDWQVACNLDTFGELNFRQGASTGAEPNSGTTRMVLTAAGDVSVSTGNVVMATSGKGIDFSAKTPDGSGTVGSEVLNDYEEGTFTPTVTSGGQTGIVYTPVGDTGTYTKIGRLVTFTVNLYGTYTGTFSYIMVALPFTVGSVLDAVSGYNNSSGAALVGRTDPSSARFLVVSPQATGQTGLYTGSYNV